MPTRCGERHGDGNHPTEIATMSTLRVAAQGGGYPDVSSTDRAYGA